MVYKEENLTRNNDEESNNELKIRSFCIKVFKNLKRSRKKSFVDTLMVVYVIHTTPVEM